LAPFAVQSFDFIGIALEKSFGVVDQRPPGF
jgi:hypothetical protein